MPTVNWGWFICLVLLSLDLRLTFVSCYDVTLSLRSVDVHFYFIPGMGCKVIQSSYLYVSLSNGISRQPHVQTSQNFLYVTCGRGCFLLWRQCNTLCTSSFVVMTRFHIMRQIQVQTWRLWNSKWFTVTRQVAALIDIGHKSVEVNSALCTWGKVCYHRMPCCILCIVVKCMSAERENTYFV